MEEGFIHALIYSFKDNKNEYLSYFYLKKRNRDRSTLSYIFRDLNSRFSVSHDSWGYNFHAFVKLNFTTEDICDLKLISCREIIDEKHLVQVIEKETKAKILWINER